MSKASLDILGKLHAALAQSLLDILQLKDADDKVIPPTAAEMAVIVNFLKANNIVAGAEDSDALAALKEKLAEKRKKTPPVMPDMLDMGRGMLN